jgi:hypothetical protein
LRLLPNHLLLITGGNRSIIKRKGRLGSFMERYFILAIAVTLVAVTTPKKNRQEARFCNTQQEERRSIASVATCDDGADFADILSSYTTFKATAGVFSGKRVYKATSYKNSVREFIKKGPMQVNKWTGCTNPRVLYNVLQSVPMGEPYYIE